MSKSTLLITSTAVFDLTKFIKSMDLNTISLFANDIDDEDVSGGALEIQGKTAEQILEARPFGTMDMLPYDAFCEPDEYVVLENLDALIAVVDEHFTQTFADSFETLEELEKFKGHTEKLHARQLEIYKDNEEALTEVSKGYAMALKAIALATERLTPKC